MTSSNTKLTNKNIVWLCRFYQPHIGGVERHVSEVSRILKKKGYSILVITEQYAKELPLEEASNGVRILRIPANCCGYKLKTWRWFFKLLRSERNLRDSLWHAHDVHWWLTPFVLMPIIQKVFVTFHGYEHMEKPSIREIFWRMFAQRFSCGCIMVGEWIAQWFHLQPGVITYGGSDVQILPLPKTQHAVSIGRLETDTGIGEVAELLSEHPSVSLDVYGDGTLKRLIEEKSRSCVRIQYRGIISDVKNPLQSATIVFASQYLSILEAMQAGRSVISYAGSRLKQQYLDVFPGRKWLQVWSTQDELRAILNDPKPLQKEAQQWALSQTWERVAHTYTQLWSR